MDKPGDNHENYNLCLCPTCTLFADCNKGKNEKLFCARKKSACPMDASKMCICGRCPVYDQNDLSGGYFCINEISE